MKTQYDWGNFYMEVVDSVSKLSYAKDKKVGCVIVKDGNILSFSYNGTAPGSSNNTESEGKTLPTVFHAEEAAICKMAKQGTSTAGATLYCTLSPCIHCAKLILQSGISKVVYKEEYKDTSGIKFLQQNSVIVIKQIPKPEHCSLISMDDLQHTGLI